MFSSHRCYFLPYYVYNSIMIRFGLTVSEIYEEFQNIFLLTLEWLKISLSINCAGKAIRQRTAKATTLWALSTTETSLFITCAAGTRCHFSQKRISPHAPAPARKVGGTKAGYFLSINTNPPKTPQQLKIANVTVRGKAGNERGGRPGLFALIKRTVKVNVRQERDANFACVRADGRTPPQRGRQTRKMAFKARLTG